MDEHTDVHDHITLTEATRLTPKRLTPNALWRWCRRGVRARTGERVRLQHVRLGGRIYTTRAWLDEFGRRLSAADSVYFDRQEAEADRLPRRDDAVFGSPRDRRRLGRDRARREDDARRGQQDAEEIDAELAEEGL